MSNVFKNSLLIIVAVIICVVTSLVGSRAFAQSELLFPVSKNVSYIAPSIDVVFANHLQVDVFADSTMNTHVVLVDTDTDTYIEEVPAEDSFIVRSSLRFPVRQRASYTAPSIDVVFANHLQVGVFADSTMSTHTVLMDAAVNSYIEEVYVEDTFLARSELRFPVVKRASYTAPDLEVVFVGISYNEISVADGTTDKRSFTTTKKQKKIAQKITSLREQVADLEQRIALLKENATANDFGCGSCGTHVKNLQRFLNRKGFILATTGAGSIGSETSFFGPRTLAALKNFQSAYAIPVTGVVDLRTRDLIDSIESNVLGKIITVNCVTPNKKSGQEEIIRNDQNDKDGTKSISGNFFTNLFKKIVDFFRNLFLIA